MKIKFHLMWAPAKITKKAFKSDAAFSLLEEYAARISKFTPCVVSGGDLKPKREPAVKLWLCHRSDGARALSSEAAAKSIEFLMTSGAKELIIAIGGANGFQPADIENLTPDLLWCFGPLTLPHELAGVVAAEQVYRAFTIVNRLPYHCGH